MISVPPGTRQQLLLVWSNGKVRITRGIPLADLAYLVKQLKAAGVVSDSDAKVRCQLDKELAKEFPPSQGASPA
jgi:hypothetical protein